jgi:hypothetical protein
MELCRSNPDVSLISTDFDVINSGGTVLRQDSVLGLRQYRRMASKQLTEAASLLTTDFLARSLPEWGLFLPSTVLLSRNLLRHIGGFNTSVVTEDSEFFLRCIARGKAAMIERPLVGYMGTIFRLPQRGRGTRPL